MVKKPGKWFVDENIQRITVKRKKIYIGKKKKRKRPTLSYEFKKSKDTQLVGQKKKTAFGLVSYYAKSAQYWVEQNSNDNYLVSQELTYYSFAKAAHQGT